MVNPIISVRIMRRVNHGTDVIQMLCHLPVNLSHGIRIHTTVDDSAEHIRGYKESGSAQFLILIFHKIEDHLGPAATLGILLRKHCILHALFRTKAYIIKLDLIKSQLLRFQSNLCQILPGFFFIRIHPGMVIPVLKHRAIRFLHAPVRLCLGKPRITKSRNPRNGIDMMIL